MTITCPAGCKEIEGKVYGDKIYTDDSSICLAAMHYGTLSDLGGDVEIKIVGAQNVFRGIEKNGIQSLSRGQYIRGFEV